MAKRALCLGLLLCVLPAVAQETITTVETTTSFTRTLENERVRFGVTIREEDQHLSSDFLEATESWLEEHGSGPVYLATDAGFLLDMMYTGWRAPGRLHNADNSVNLTQSDFVVEAVEPETPEEGGDALVILLKGKETTLEVRISYLLDPGGFWVKKQVAVRDPEDRGHFLRRAWPLNATVHRPATVIKAGGFGDPAVIGVGDGGFFFGMEYPAATNAADRSSGEALLLRAGQEIGERIGTEWVESEWAVIGLSPDGRIKRWFETYLDSVRVAPVRPYALYNTWYDVRSPEYTERDEDVMNEENLFRILGDFEEVMERYPGFRLDAFVLDDGWDVYASDWDLRDEQFPNRLRPVAEAVAGIGADLGIWFGPTGGYSFRDARIDWLEEHGYERVGNQMCLAGERYGDLLMRRTVDLVRGENVGYFKWDGIQFSCSEPDHGHLPGIYSRRAVMEAVIDMCEAVREVKPDIFLNITSGTWMSPWWLKYADTIWMQGYDYGYSDVPSISKRDRAITYRDVVLHENYGVNDLWFPITGLMTHGIIKGHLQKLGGEAEPLDKFTDNAVLYFARGVAMWEFYVSPDLLTDSEWKTIAAAMAWARDRFDVLQTTEMVGGDPGANEPYGYVHFAGDRGIVVARNPFVAPATLEVTLSSAHGLDAGATSLVLERVYPTRWVSPRLYSAGQIVELPLGGYETAVYELYPLVVADGPVLAGAVFESFQGQGEDLVFEILESSGEVRILNPETARSVTVAGNAVEPGPITLPPVDMGAVVGGVDATATPGGLDLAFDLSEGNRATLAVLVRPEEKTGKGLDPEVTLELDEAGAETRVESQEGTWSWHLVDVGAGSHAVRVTVAPAEGDDLWKGSVEAWLLTARTPRPVVVTVSPAGPATLDRPLPPRPWPAGELHETVKLGEARLGQR